MEHVLRKVDDQIQRYKTDHHGEMPLYILVSPHEADVLITEVRQASGYKSDVLVTSYKGSKIVRHDGLKEGELRLTDELPETGS
jgi:hypothetical protein